MQLWIKSILHKMLLLSSITAQAALIWDSHPDNLLIKLTMSSSELKRKKRVLNLENLSQATRVLTRESRLTTSLEWPTPTPANSQKAATNVLPLKRAILWNKLLSSCQVIHRLDSKPTTEPRYKNSEATHGTRDRAAVGKHYPVNLAITHSCIHHYVKLSD